HRQCRAIRHRSRRRSRTCELLDAPVRVDDPVIADQRVEPPAAMYEPALANRDLGHPIACFALAEFDLERFSGSRSKQRRCQWRRSPAEHRWRRFEVRARPEQIRPQAALANDRQDGLRAGLALDRMGELVKVGHWGIVRIAAQETSWFLAGDGGTLMSFECV